jgi:hypothetical protein
MGNWTAKRSVDGEGNNGIAEFASLAVLTVLTKPQECLSSPGRICPWRSQFVSADSSSGKGGADVLMGLVMRLHVVRAAATCYVACEELFSAAGDPICACC